jgi:hypothetical protein
MTACRSISLPYDLRRSDLSSFFTDIEIGRPIDVQRPLAQVNAALSVVRKSGQELIADFYDLMGLPGNACDFPANANIVRITKFAAKCVAGKRTRSGRMTR